MFVSIFVVSSTFLFVSSGKNVSIHNRCGYDKFCYEERLFAERLGNGIDAIKNCLGNLLRKIHHWIQGVPRPEDRTRFLENLLNSFSLIRRLTKTWPIFLSDVTSCFDVKMKSLDLSLDVPVLQRSALTGLVRLQETYNISTSTLTNGLLDGTHNHSQLTASDCFEVGRIYSHLMHPTRAVEWLEEALRMSDDDTELSRQQVLEYLHLAYCFKGDANQSTLAIRTLLQINPHFTPSEELKGVYDTIATSTCENLAEKIREMTYQEPHDVHNVQGQEGLCKTKNLPTTDSRLKCRLLHYHQDHLRIWPFKMEELRVDPPLLMFHGVIHDQEIQHFKTAYHKKTRPAMKDYGPEYDPYQDTQSVHWLETSDIVVKRIETRASWMSNLGLRRSPRSLLASYGLAGEIKTHFDLGPDESGIFQDIAEVPSSRADLLTHMYYLNDVPEGGYTIFPNMTGGTAIVPEKGAAIIWFNRFPDWSRDFASAHSGCPVLRGSKWIITKFFNAAGQDFGMCHPKKRRTHKYFYL